MSHLTSSHESWLSAMLMVAKHYRLDFSEENVRVALSWDNDTSLDLLLEDMGRQLGLESYIAEFSEKFLDPWRMPFIVLLRKGDVAVLERMDSVGQVSVQFSNEGGLALTMSVSELSEHVERLVILRPLTAIPDIRVDEYIKPFKKNWFWEIALRDWRRYGEIIAASLAVNVLALASIIFSLQVYDRVIPAQSYPTLWVLFSGVILAVFFEFTLRMVRTYISDSIGKRADLKISDRVLGHALRVQNSARSKSTGSFISQIRELEQVRELITSTTIGAVADLPFFFLFVFILWMIGGPLVFVVLAAVPMLVIPGLLVQRPFSKLSNDGMRESAIRNATLVEVVESIEDIKLLRAEQRFQNQWNHNNEVAANISMRQRFLTAMLMTWTQQVTTLVYASVLLIGCYMVIQGDLTTGSLVAMTLLSSRTIAPLSQITGVLSRWQQAKVARKGLDELMNRPIDQPARGKAVHKASLRGAYQLKGVEFLYDPEGKTSDISIAALSIKEGEKVAVLGRNGAGKSTLLQLLSGMRFPSQGQLLLDDIAITSLDTADLRRDMGFLHQNSRLFFGSIRENLTMGRPLATDEEIYRALLMSGALTFVQKQTKALDYMILEGGYGLSGGQRQALMLARMLITQPNIVLLDEPTAAMDDVTEREVIAHLKDWLGPRTLVLATHRPALLELVDRVIIVDSGNIVMDGEKSEILNKVAKP
ncbi:type I secretion system permease/ATPase [Pseudomonas sp. M30-35]|uniref:type I secretion system permease/ATPase n=1 Tax=Pseudomonas sp. M30-35 TaxID=1981174 RepID=UPI000B579BFA|nr:type I secretion system permease/ATPase [Pseudomonas sp. M30-35]ARU88413.1 type I secretion system permease/ATPase [Pseudomonas sp. M30-35]